MNDQISMKKLWWIVWGVLLLVIAFFTIMGILYLRSRSAEITNILGVQPVEQPALVIPTVIAEAESDSQPLATPIQPTDIPPTEERKPTATPTIEPTAPVTAIPILIPTVAKDLPATQIPVTGEITLYKLSSPPSIDGWVGDWSAELPTYSSPYIVYEYGWDQVDDIEAVWRLAWTDSHLYISAEVFDEQHVQIETGGGAFRGDSVEIQIDTEREQDFGYGLSDDDIQWIISPGNFTDIPPSLYRYRGSSATGQILTDAAHSGELRANKVPKGYIIEAKIPWTDLYSNPYAGKKMGITLNLNDNDTPNTSQQPIMKSNISTRAFDDPQAWQVVTFSAEAR